MWRTGGRVVNFLAWLFVLTVSLRLPVQAQTEYFPLRLKPQKFPFVAKEYYISKTLDRRDDKNGLGDVIIAGTSSSYSKQTINFPGEANEVLSKFLGTGFQRKAELRPVVVSLKKLKITEKQQDGLVVGAIEIVLLFELDKEIPEKLLEYRGGSKYSRAVDQVSALETIMGNTLINSIKYFNTWMDSEANTNEKLARKLELRFSEVKSALESDTVFYSATRKLAWTDFASEPDRKSPFAAEIFPFFSFEQSSRVVDGTIHVSIVPKVYMVKSFSWVKDNARTHITLNHEQRHFDIVKIAAERFRQKISKEVLTVDNYQGILSVEYLQALREMNALQKEYDGETGHGTDMIIQQRWNSRIDSQLRSYFTSIGKADQRR